MSATHKELVSNLVKSPQDIIDNMSLRGMNSLHMAIGIAGEAGEVLELVKKSSLHNKELDVSKLINELGDIEFYMEGMRQEFGITREQCIEANISKLSERYASGKYTDKESAERRDVK